MATQDKLCILLDATRAGNFEVFQFDAITAACGDLADVYLVTNLADTLLGPRHLNISNDEIFAPDNNLKQAKSVIPGNPDLKLLAALKRPELAGYDRFVRIEFDCVFSKDIADTVRRLDALSRVHDLGYSFGFRQVQHKAWPWWEGVRNHKAAVEPPGTLRAGFLPVLMFNRRFIDAYTATLRDGWTGHYEALIPSTAEWHGLSAIDFEKTPDLRIKRPVFTVHRPKTFDAGGSDFFHPVKTFDAFLMLPARVARTYAAYAPEPAERFGRFALASGVNDGPLDLVKRVLRDGHRLLCYGSPGVAQVAVAHGLQTAWLVTSSRADALAVAAYPPLATARDLGQLRVEFIALGRVNHLGTPYHPEETWKFGRYFWQPVERPDIIFNGGRFRVAVAAHHYLQYGGDAAVRVLLNNRKRPHYAPILDLYEEVELAGDVALLRAVPGKEVEAQAIFDAHREDHR